MELTKIEKHLIETCGGRLWEKDEKRRIYFNDVADRAGYEWGRYNTGNLSWVRYMGEKMSNRKGGIELARVQRGKFWYDCTTGEFNSSHEIDGEEHQNILNSLNLSALDETATDEVQVNKTVSGLVQEVRRAGAAVLVAVLTAAGIVWTFAAKSAWAILGVA